MTTNNFFRSNLNRVFNIVQNSMIVFSKEMIIETLRDFFSNDLYYRYVKDEWGFPKTVDQTGLPLGSGMTDNTTTRLFIGENYRFDGIFFPALLVKAGSFKSVPISFNREQGTIKYDWTLFQDGYGNEAFFRTPSSFILAGAWEGSISVDIISRAIRSRDELSEMLGIFFTDIGFETLKKAGIIIKPPSISGPTESDDRNDKLFKSSVTIDVRTEWRREIPIGNLVELIVFSVDFGLVDVPDYPISPNLSIKTELTLLDAFNF